LVRTIQPRPSSNGSPLSISTFPTTQQPKKRGRPSKADVEARNAEAIARGEVILPPKIPARRSTGDLTAGGDSSTPRGGVAPVASLISPSPMQEPRILMPYQSGAPGTKADEVGEAEKRRWSSPRPSILNAPPESTNEGSNVPQKEFRFRQGEGSFLMAPFKQYEVAKSPMPKPVEEPVQSMAVQPPAQEGQSAPVPPQTQEPTPTEPSPSSGAPEPPKI
jgi:hypothetical protein